MKNQREFIRDFNDKYRESFNEELFAHSDEDIINELKKVILSCQRSRVFTIRVDKFTVVKDYIQIQNILKEYESYRLRNKPTEDNRYDFISLKNSDIQLLIVDYYIAVNNEKDPLKASKNLRVLIEVPRVVDKYYYKIFGNMYVPMYQVIESTYNNSSSNSKSNMVVLKTMFMASRFYRFNIENSKDKLKTTEGEYLTGVFYQSRIFNKLVPGMKYLLARYGFYGLAEAMKVPYIYLSDEDPMDTTLYTINRHSIYISIPKYIYDNDQTAQSLVYTIYGCITKETTVDMLFTQEFWLISLGESFSNPTVEKGLAILESLESIYDLSSQENLHLPEDQKDDIYKVLIWLMREYSALRLKDNLDISMKRVRKAEYPAALYAMKIVFGILRISDRGNKVTISQIEKAINTYPDFLLKSITKDRIINYRGSVNDLDAVLALKFTYKGVAGLGEKGTSIPRQYRQVHKSHIGRLDMDSVSSTDPGLSGMLCPMGENYNGQFSQNSEPNTWREDTEVILDAYRKLIGIKDVLMTKMDMGCSDSDDIDRLKSIDDTMESMSYLMRPINDMEKFTDSISEIL